MRADQQSPSWSTDAASTDAILRATGIVSLLGVALIHFAQIVDTFNGAVWLGVAFVVLIAASVAAALLLIGGASGPAWTSAGAVAVGALVGYVFTRTISTPFDNQDAGNCAETLGLAAIFLESVLLGLSIYALIGRYRYA
jgi:hypothetical protein